MNKVTTTILLVFLTIQLPAQRVLTLDDCRNLALQNNKEQKIAEEEIKIAGYKKKAAFTKYLPDISLKGAYLRNQKEMSLISQDMFLPIGTRMADGSFGFSQDQINNRWTIVNGQPAPLDANGLPFDPKADPEKIMWKNYTTIPKEELTFDTRNIYVGAINLVQPIFMGGKIVAYNKIAELSKELAASQQETNRQEIILNTDETYWQVISLTGKKKAVEGLLELLSKMEYDVDALVENGLATKADKLSVLVKKNEAEMALLKVDDGISLSKMLLAQYCGFPMEETFSLADEQTNDIPVKISGDTIELSQVYANRSEIKSLDYAQKLYRQKEKVVRADLLPNIALTANYLATNPNSVNGFKNKFDFAWNIGVMVNIPLLHWGENIHLLNAAKSETMIAGYKLSEAQEKIELQLNQSLFKQTEAAKKLQLAQKNLEKANENLRYATLGFREGVIPASNLLEAQAVWLSANSDKIDAEVEAKMSEVYLQKAMGTLGK
ncbi:MAG: TolC family protein [Prevotellaceae bacterium]|jgi:outer membrane protein TolC|nr:TolC family protein [Prevotellaceae bacterium]